MVTAFSALANGGWLLRPRLVDRVVKGDSEQTFKPERRRRILSQRTTNRLTSVLTGVVDRGTGAQAALDGYLVAGKSGTAQKVENGRYSHSKVVVSFIGYAPAEAPRFVMLVMFDEPKKKRWGGSQRPPCSAALRSRRCTICRFRRAGPVRRLKRLTSSTAHKN